MSEAIGWDIVPPTLLRDGPFGEGMVQRVVEADESVDVVAMVLEDDPRLRRMATFDAVVNNTDRKGGHILPVDGGRRDPRRGPRRVLLARPEAADGAVGLARRSRSTPTSWRASSGSATRLDGDLGASLRTLLSRTEVTATRRRVDGLLATGRFPMPSPTWPAIPWPPF